VYCFAVTAVCANSEGAKLRRVAGTKPMVRQDCPWPHIAFASWGFPCPLVHRSHIRGAFKRRKMILQLWTTLSADSYQTSLVRIKRSGPRPLIPILFALDRGCSSAQSQPACCFALKYTTGFLGMYSRVGRFDVDLIPTTEHLANVCVRRSQDGCLSPGMLLRSRGAVVANGWKP
jgi:hypothetical protein